MSTTVQALYKQGVFHPLEPFTLPESTKVQIEVFQEENGNKEFNAFQRRLVILHDVLLQMELHWLNDQERKVFPQILQTDLKALWHLCQPPQSEFCAMLELSAMHLDTDSLTLQQVSAFRFGLKLIAKEELTSENFDACHARLVEAGIPPSFSFDEETAQSYIDEL